jgi:hypothetical protein
LKNLNQEFIPLCLGEVQRNVVIMSNNCSCENFDETITISSQTIENVTSHSELEAG